MRAVSWAWRAWVAAAGDAGGLQSWPPAQLHLASPSQARPADHPGPDSRHLIAGPAPQLEEEFGSAWEAGGVEGWEDRGAGGGAGGGAEAAGALDLDAFDSAEELEMLGGRAGQGRGEQGCVVGRSVGRLVGWVDWGGWLGWVGAGPPSLPRRALCSPMPRPLGFTMGQLSLLFQAAALCLERCSRV